MATPHRPTIWKPRQGQSIVSSTAELRDARARVALAYDPRPAASCRPSTGRSAGRPSRQGPGIDGKGPALVRSGGERATGRRRACPGPRFGRRPRRLGRSVRPDSPNHAGPRAQPARSAVHRPSGGRLGAAGRAVRCPRIGHQPGHGHLRNGALGDRRRMGHGRAAGPTDRLASRPVRRAGDPRRVAGQPHRAA